MRVIFQYNETDPALTNPDLPTPKALIVETDIIPREGETVVLMDRLWRVLTPQWYMNDGEIHEVTIHLSGGAPY